MIFCSNCGLLLPADADRCPRCGAPAPEPTAGPGPAAAPAQPHYQGAAAPGPDTLSTGAYFGYLLLFSVPVVGFIIALVFAFRRAGNRARRRFARAFVLYVLVVIGLLLMLYILAAVVMFLSMRLYTAGAAGPWQ